jgi:glycine/D-amino acid oxidase-like deaminating enzyme
MTPAGPPLLGPVPGVAGPHVASGCCAGGLSLSSAAGPALADLVVDGWSDPDLGPLSVERLREGAVRDEETWRAACVERYARKYLK